ncbi:MAG: HAD family phosphatase [Bacteroidota bacterium]
MMNSQAKTEQPFSIILFDLGNVLVQIDYAAFPRTLGFDHQMTKSELFHLVEDEARAFEMGKSSAIEFLGVINRELGKSYTFDQFRKAWTAILPSAVPGSQELLERLAGRYRLMMLSNTNELHFQHTVEMLPVLQRFERFFLSYEIGVLKPDRAIYEYVLKHVDVPAQRILFIDDLEQNVVGAESVGIKGIVFRGIEHLLPELERLRII